MRHILLFGASGAIGQALAQHFQNQPVRLICVRRPKTDAISNRTTSWVTWHPAEEDFCKELHETLQGSACTSVIWAQGVNFNDSIIHFDEDAHLQMYEANVLFILRSLSILIQKNFLADQAKLCIISSIWQKIARPSKLSYCVTKSAIEGLVQSLCIDLGSRGILINAVLPGALDTPMTRANLNSQQIRILESATPLLSLPQLNDVVSLVDYLCSPSNTGITGQFIRADRGFSDARIF
jgi:3-oxoacyl-[acyl-carrier protein] reductase